VNRTQVTRAQAITFVAGAGTFLVGLTVSLLGAPMILLWLGLGIGLCFWITAALWWYQGRLQNPAMTLAVRQIGSELRDIRHKIEIVKSTRPHPHYSDMFRLPGARWDEYDEVLAKDPALYRIVEAAYTAAHHVNEAVDMRRTRAGEGVTVAVIPDDGVDAAYDTAGEALDALGEERGPVWETEASRAVRVVTEDILQEIEDDEKRDET
jgi:hypothetical protein